MAFCWHVPQHMDGKFCVHPDDMRAWEACELRDWAGRGQMLMEVAGREVAMHILQRHAMAKDILVFCGQGNNGGDGLVCAHYLRQAGRAVHIFAFDEGVVKTPDAMAMFARVRDLPRVILKSASDAGQILAWRSRRDVLVVDAIFGTGYRPSRSALMARVYQCIAELAFPVISIDIASGIDASTGYRGTVSDTSPPRAMIASETITFGAPKYGHFYGEGPGHTGELFCVDIGLRGWPDLGQRTLVLADDDCSRLWSLERGPDVHKGRCGHVFVLGGSAAMPGAARLSARAALRTGCGLVTIASSGKIQAPDEVMCVSMADAEGEADLSALKDIFERADVLVVGPGLGRTPQTVAIVKACAGFQKCLVLDADALWALAQIEASDVSFAAHDLFLTPHPGEAAHLCQVSVPDILRAPGRFALDLSQRCQATVILKSHVTHVATWSATNPRISLCPYPNAAMATAGMGDVLAGMIGALVAQSRGGALGRWLDTFGVASMAVNLHSRAGRRAAKVLGNALCAGDLIEAIHVG